MRGPTAPLTGSALQSKRGTLWNNQPLQTENWSALVKFRVSGQGKTLFGDGFAFWAAKGARFMEGPFFGVTDRFEGGSATRRGPADAPPGAASPAPALTRPALVAPPAARVRDAQA